MIVPSNLDLFGVRALIESAFREDYGGRDLTVEAVLGPAAAARVIEARIITKAPGVVAGLAIAAACYGYLDRQIAFRAAVGDGEWVEPGSVLATVHGPAGLLLSGERTALNFLGRMCGVATLARQFVDAVAGTGAVVCDTRKTTPGYRALEKYAAAKGGVTNHRMGLYDQVLIKENHLAGANADVAEAVRRAAAHFSEGNARPTIGVEVKNLAEFELALRSDADLILLDNFEPAEVAEAVKRRAADRSDGAGRPLLEASGGIRLENARAYAETGVDRLSVGAITHSAPTLDLSCLFDWHAAENPPPANGDDAR